MVENSVYIEYIYKCRQYCFGLLGLISAVLMLELREGYIAASENPTYVGYSYLARVLKLHRRNPTAVKRRCAQRCDSKNEHSALTAMVQIVMLLR